MKTSLVPIISSKTGDSSDKNNYRPIALLTAASKLFEICILEILETYLVTTDQNLVLKVSTPLTCVFSLLKVSLSITRNKIPLCTLAF